MKTNELSLHCLWDSVSFMAVPLRAWGHCLKSSERRTRIINQVTWDGGPMDSIYFILLFTARLNWCVLIIWFLICLSPPVLNPLYNLFAFPHYTIYHYSVLFNVIKSHTQQQFVQFLILAGSGSCLFDKEMLHCVRGGAAGSCVSNWFSQNQQQNVCVCVCVCVCVYPW